MAAALAFPGPLAVPFRSTRPTHRRLGAVGAGGATALRRARDRDAGTGPRRHRRRLRHGPVRRPEARNRSGRRMPAGRARSTASSKRRSRRWCAGGEDGRDPAGLGPCIAQEFYEVGPEFVARFRRAGRRGALLRSERKAGREMFDLTAISPSGRAGRASSISRTAASTPTPTRRASSAIEGRPIARRRTTGGSCRRSRLRSGGPSSCPPGRRPGGCRRMRDPRHSGEICAAGQ